MKIVVTLNRTDTSGQLEQDVFDNGTEWTVGTTLRIRDTDNNTLADYSSGSWLSVKKVD